MKKNINIFNPTINGYSQKDLNLLKRGKRKKATKDNGTNIGKIAIITLFILVLFMFFINCGN
jgi:hypothetical protein